VSITKDDAETIAKKLLATLDEGGSHTKAVVRHQHRIIARFGIRRGSRRDAGHGHIPGMIHLGQPDTKKLASCTLDREGYLSILRAQNLL